MGAGCESGQSGDGAPDAGKSRPLFTGSCLLDTEQNSPAGEKKAIRQLEAQLGEDPTVGLASSRADKSRRRGHASNRSQQTSRGWGEGRQEERKVRQE